MNIFKNLFNKPSTQSTSQTEAKTTNDLASSVKKHNVTGVAHYEKNILKLAMPNPAYDYKAKEIINSKLVDVNIYQYRFSPIKTELIPEPTNTYDPNAIKVVVDCEHVGYMKSGSCSKILKLISEERIEKIDCKISGGLFKMLSLCGDGGEYEIEKGKDNFKIHIFITEKQ